MSDGSGGRRPTVRVLMEGRGLVESARWRDGRFWFADWMSGDIIALGLDGTSEVVAHVASLPLCFDWLPDGRLIAVDGRRLVVCAPDGSLSTYADLSHLGDHGYNDIAVDPRGNVFVNNVDFEFPGGEPRPGFIALVSPHGDRVRVADDVLFPNGMRVSPDGSTLIVAQSYRGELTGFAIDEDGALLDRRVWADLGDDAPDGIAVDASGAVWYASVPGKHCVRVREGGEVLDRVAFDRGSFSCAVGGDDGNLLCATNAQWAGIDSLSGAPSFDGQVVITPIAPAG
ncbi:MAG TPA: SMP-30/gluconolactonase/LRE family protein [Mycobacteriales bacterium]|nr:SMP-30/gluconolactonase/LRE family protein [Mycobacteriales bacterium]